MAIKVIGIDTSEIKRITCKKCASILEYTQADTTTEKISDYTGSSEIYRFLNCPQCNNKISLFMY